VINENERLSKYETLTIEPGHGKLIRLRFMYYPEYIHKGMRVLINEN
jgi:GTPase